MIDIDGSVGGGQILRTALGFSTLLKKSGHIFNIRKNRKNPGLGEQHWQGLRVISNLCGARVKGCQKGSQEIEFYPGDIGEKELHAEVHTAGSIGLLLQPLLIPGFKHNLKVKVDGGGTFAESAPPVDYLTIILNYWLRQIGMQIDANILRQGFYPKGGARVEISLHKASPNPAKFNLLDLGKPTALKGISIASNGLKKKQVAERQLQGARPLLRTANLPYSQVDIKYVNTFGDGCGILLWLELERGIIGSSAFGRRGKWAQDVGKEAAQILVKDFKSGGIDRFAADQLMPFLALVGGRIKVSQVTDHVKTNIQVIKQFLPTTKFKITDNIIEVTG